MNRTRLRTTTLLTRSAAVAVASIKVIGEDKQVPEFRSEFDGPAP